MQLHEIRRAIQDELGKKTPNQDTISALIIKRDQALAATAAPAPMSAEETHLAMLDWTHS